MSVVEEQLDLTGRIRMWYIIVEKTIVVIQEDGEVRFYEEITT